MRNKQKIRGIVLVAVISLACTFSSLTFSLMGMMDP